ncbi:MAG: hypothetical protein M1822_007242 [Bathelium mastoideum]|nr:MAG: hypothetical protein M1822_007242 [Bathelium mastoideum]
MEQVNPLASFHAISIQAKTTLEVLLRLNPEVQYFNRNGDHLVRATLENMKANLDSTLHDLLKFFRNHARDRTVSSHGANLSMQQRLLLTRDELSMNTQDLLSYHTRLRERMGQTTRTQPGQTMRSHAVPGGSALRTAQSEQKHAVPYMYRPPSRSARPYESAREQLSSHWGTASNLQNSPLRRQPSRSGGVPPQIMAPYPQDGHHWQGRGRQPALARSKSVQTPYRAYPSQTGQHEQSSRQPNQPRRSRSLQPLRDEHHAHESRSRSAAEAVHTQDNAAYKAPDIQIHKVSGPISVLFVDSFNGTRSILAHCCAELFRLWTLNNGAPSPFSAVDSAGTRLRSSFLKDAETQDWTLYSPADAQVNHDAIRAMLSRADTPEEYDIGARLSKHRPRGLTASDFEDFDFILTLDARNYSRLRWLRSLLSASPARIFLLQNVQAPSSPPLEESQHRRSGDSAREYFISPNYEPLITTLTTSLSAFLATHTTWQPPTHPPFSHRYTPFRSRQFVAPVGIREPTDRRIEELRRTTGCGIVVDRVIWGKEEGKQGGRVVVVSVTGREEVLSHAWDIVRWELGGWI